ncbi:uncharacterized protein RHIMIDRAFT_294596 [Rhizopus microsporus ATCC 52813]|uniref:Uncharacterized protein n=1 Tax=Rhizopus microsporus ATCC 52813 TaxID=1340429 RepID=A0A2G4SJX5_RHIZD|nr:uncharacterized protein RHIMIDRAFT_294596 [Rhizopus microsporus ATCC 52813]PHZ09069.1 hypothetical protein RHIMIDRAFT_294596 [Rhizopus microsporus ATCC 52813]
MARLFSLFPVPSLKWRSVSINPNMLSSFAGKPKQSNYEDKFNMFHTVFDLSSLGVNRSDGFAADVVLYKGVNNNEDICNSCENMAFTSAFINFHGIQSCAGCGLLWQRDINGSKNIFKIANGIFRECGRPQAFCRRIEHGSPSGV